MVVWCGVLSQAGVPTGLCHPKTTCNSSVICECTVQLQKQNQFTFAKGHIFKNTTVARVCFHTLVSQGTAARGEAALTWEPLPCFYATSLSSEALLGRGSRQKPTVGLAWALKEGSVWTWVTCDELSAGLLCTSCGVCCAGPHS